VGLFRKEIGNYGAGASLDGRVSSLHMPAGSGVENQQRSTQWRLEIQTKGRGERERSCFAEFEFKTMYFLDAQS